MTDTPPAPSFEDVIDRLDELVLRVVRIELICRDIVKRMEDLMVTVQDVQAKADQELAQITAEKDLVAAVKSVVDNQNAKLAALQAQITQLQSLQVITPADLQKLSDTIDSILQADTANAAVVSAAVAAGTGTAPAA